jgi:four helix bundle protein
VDDFDHGERRTMRRFVDYERAFVMHDFRRLEVWQRSRELAVALDALTRGFPRSDRGVVAGQLRRAALSIPANIAEGCGKSSRRETIRFLQIASGSARETENHLLIAADLGYVSPRAREELTGHVKSIERMLIGLINNLPG